MSVFHRISLTFSGICKQNARIAASPSQEKTGKLPCTTSFLPVFSFVHMYQNSAGRLFTRRYRRIRARQSDEMTQCIKCEMNMRCTNDPDSHGTAFFPAVLPGRNRLTDALFQSAQDHRKRTMQSTPSSGSYRSVRKCLFRYSAGVSGPRLPQL